MTWDWECPSLARIPKKLNYYKYFVFKKLEFWNTLGIFRINCYKDVKIKTNKIKNPC